MRTYGRLLALGAICAGALGLTAVPASAVTISIGGQNPTVPVTLPLPVSISAGVDSGGVQADVQAPGSTDVSVKADPSGVHAKATVADHPLATVDASTPAVTSTPAPAAGSDPVAGAPVVSTPTASGPSPATVSDPVAGNAPSAHDATAPHASAGPAAVAERDLSGATRADSRTPDVTAEIASSPSSSSGFLHSLPIGGARTLLWIALAGAVLAFRWFVGSSTKRASRAS